MQMFRIGLGTLCSNESSVVVIINAYTDLPHTNKI